MRWLVRRVVLWAMPELHATVEREQWISAFWQAAQQQAIGARRPADDVTVTLGVEMN